MKSYIIKKVKNIEKGLFANRDYKKGELILRVDLSKLKSYSSEEIAKMPNNDHADYVGHGRYALTFLHILI